MTIWLIDVFRTPTGAVHIGIIRDEANDATPKTGPRVDVQPLSENLVDTVEKAQGDNNATS